MFSLLSCFSAISLANVETLKINLSRYYPNIQVSNIQATEMEKTRDELNHILAAASGQPLEKIQKDTDRDFFLNAKEAIEYGLADKIVEGV